MPKNVLSPCTLLFIAFAVFSGCAGNKNDRGNTEVDRDYMNKLDAPLRSVLSSPGA